MQDAYGAVPGYSADSAIERNIAQFRILSPRIPESVELGYHFCFGTLGGWPRFRAGRSVGNRAACQRHHRGVGPPRRLDSHSGSTRRQGILLRAAEGFRPRGARVYLGVIHHMDGFKERIALARKYLPEFGLAAYCGFGRIPPADMPAVLNEHLQAIQTAG